MIIILFKKETSTRTRTRTKRARRRRSTKVLTTKQNDSNHYKSLFTMTTTVRGIKYRTHVACFKMRKKTEKEKDGQ